MELVSCKNCCHVYGDVQDECPVCGADDLGNGAEVELDNTTRMAVRSLGGVYGGILEGAQHGVYLLWCERGVVRYDDESGLVWHTSLGARVDGLSPGKEQVQVTVGRREIALDPADGSRVD